MIIMPMLHCAAERYAQATNQLDIMSLDNIINPVILIFIK